MLPSSCCSPVPQNATPMLCCVHSPAVKAPKTQTVCYAMFILPHSRSSNRKPYAMPCDAMLCSAMPLHVRASEPNRYALLCSAHSATIKGCQALCILLQSGPQTQTLCCAVFILQQSRASKHEPYATLSYAMFILQSKASKCKSQSWRVFCRDDSLFNSLFGTSMSSNCFHINYN